MIVGNSAGSTDDSTVPKGIYANGVDDSVVKNNTAGAQLCVLCSSSFLRALPAPRQP